MASAGDDLGQGKPPPRATEIEPIITPHFISLKPRSPSDGSDSAYATLEDEEEEQRMHRNTLGQARTSGTSTPRRRSSLKEKGALGTGRGGSRTRSNSSSSKSDDLRSSSHSVTTAFGSNDPRSPVSPNSKYRLNSLTVSPSALPSNSLLSPGKNKRSSVMTSGGMTGKKVKKKKKNLIKMAQDEQVQGPASPYATRSSTSSSRSITPTPLSYRNSTSSSNSTPKHRSQSIPSSPLLSVVDTDASMIAEDSRLHPDSTSIALIPLTTITTLFTLSLSVFSLLASSSSAYQSYQITPVSPLHLLHPQNAILSEYANAVLSIFLVRLERSKSQDCVLGIINLYLLSSLERRLHYKKRTRKVIDGVCIWSSILTTRIGLAWLFGRAVGWAWPELFSTAAIASVGNGLAPLLLTLSILDSTSSASSSSQLLSVALLALNFFPSPPILSSSSNSAGTDLWWGISAVFVGLVIVVSSWIRKNVSAFTNGKKGATVERTTFPSGRLLSLLLLISFPLLSTLSLSTVSSISPLVSPEATFAHLSPLHPNLFTILLMTAPRPGDPEFLNRSLESWLSALPDPASTSPAALSISNRMRLIVFTHFPRHPQFDAAQQFFTTSPLWKIKAEKYIEWKRDERCLDEAEGGGNRLDQRLHVARGLEYASRANDSAYVVLTEDDFPLCPDPPSTCAVIDDDFNYRSIVPRVSFETTWKEIMRVAVETNRLMPDRRALLSSGQEEEVLAGHCGIFFATGGSGLIIRSFIAKKLPMLLLGDDDRDGVKRVARFAELRRRGIVDDRIKKEKDADTPDLVIQDCLRGRLPVCAVCAVPDASSSTSFDPASSRNAFITPGDRHGKSGLTGTKVLLQRHLGYNTSTLPGREYGKEEWTCGWRQPFNGEPDVLTL